nr:alpha/beta fold hydrolase [Roseomonas haemaphysalidis]
MTDAVIAHAFAQVGNRRVHYARGGEGPPLIMLHAAPCSAKVMRPIQKVFATRFTTFAFDLPGCGLSDPLPAGPLATEDLADAILATLDALGLGRVLAYGRHTGAGVAVELAHRHPERVAMVLTDGFPVFAAPMSEQRIHENLPPIVPRWDGTHLLWCWYRYREQHIFAPWDRPLAECRADTDVPDPDFLHRGTVELLEAGDEYRRIFASAFRHAGLGMIGALQVPVCFGTRPGDSLHSSRTLYPPEAWTEVLPREQIAAAMREREILSRHAQGLPAAPPHAGRLAPGPGGIDYLQTPAGETLVRAYGLERERMPVVVLHDIPGASALDDALLRELGTLRPSIGFDLSGLGESAPPPGQAISVGLWVEQLRAVCRSLGLERVHLLAQGAAAAVAAEAALAAPGLVAGLTLRSPPILTPALRRDFLDHPIPAADPVEDGSHLLRLWHQLRDQELFFPWFRRTRDHARGNAPRLQPEALQARARACLKQPHSLAPAWATAMAYPLEQRLAQLRAAVALASHPADIFAPRAAAAASFLGREALPMPEDAGLAASTLDQSIGP